MEKPVKVLPPGYIPVGSVSLKKSSDLIPMTVWSLVLPVLTLPAIYLVLRASSEPFSIKTGGNFIESLGGILLMTGIMIVVHEGLHGVVFWVTTHEPPRFAFKVYYASTSSGDWYLPRTPFMIATLLPLILITAVGLFLLLLTGAYLRYLLILLIVFNASGAAGDLLVALRMAKLPSGVLAHDSGAEVTFFAPVNPAN